jgi:deoxycytidine triphosphate deaminase
MLLSEIDIALRLVELDEKKRLVITPIINAKEQFGPSSFDVHLGTDFSQLENVNLPSMLLKEDLSADEEASYMKKVLLSAGKTFFLHPGEFVLGEDLASWFMRRRDSSIRGMLVRSPLSSAMWGGSLSS